MSEHNRGNDKIRRFPKASVAIEKQKQLKQRLMKKFRPPRKVRKARRRPINVLASMMTTLSLYCGVVSIFASIGQHYDKAVTFILLAVVFDMLDGSVARLTNSVSEFGKELDSLCDLVSFGVAPAVLTFTFLLPDGIVESKKITADDMNAVLAILFVICGALRLARFNVFQADRHDMFTGLPIPAAGATLASFVLFLHYFGFGNSVWMLGPLTLGLSYLMVSTVHYPKDKLKYFVLAPQHAFRMLAICGIAIAVFHYAITRSPAIVLFPLGMAYVLFGIGDELIHYLKRPKGQTSDEDADYAGPEESDELEPSSKTAERL